MSTGTNVHHQWYRAFHTMKGIVSNWTALSFGDQLLCTHWMLEFARKKSTCNRYEVENGYYTY